MNTCAMPLADDELLPDSGFVTMEPKTSWRTDIDLSVPLFAALVIEESDSVCVDCAMTAVEVVASHKAASSEPVRVFIVLTRDRD